MSEPAGPNGPSFERITPRPLTPVESESGTGSSAPPAALGNNPLTVALLILVAVLLVVIVFLLLPQRSVAPEPPAPLKPATESKALPDAATKAADTAPSGLQVQDAETVLANRKAAAEVGNALRLRLQELSRRAVTEWGAEDWNQLTAGAEQGQQQFDARAYEAARDTWSELMPLADSMMDQLGWEYLGALQQGQQALVEGERGAALEAFERALRMNPAGEEAARGLQRAEVLDDVLLHLEAASRLEREGDLTGARSRLERAAAMDPESPEVARALARVNEAIDTRNFRAAMGRAEAALEQGRFDRARRALNSAAKLRPDDPAVMEARGALAVAEQLQKVRALKAAAGEFERQEQWDEAANRYRRIVALDPTLDFAREGLRRAQHRAEIDAAFSAFIAKPDRLFEAKEKQAADALLQRAREVQNPGQRLRDQVDWLQRALALAREPIPVVLVSDGETEVLLYKVGKLGQFERKPLDLLPGNYTALGRCEGYRDNRLQFSLRPGESGKTVTVRCTERL